ncbi:MAG: hypothetical protein K8Q89_01120 [Nitrosarchaeum sp.]|nr:hypothetical protein [Nitrosarchaeum sp.]
MKTRVLTTIVILILSLSISQSSALIESHTPEELYDIYDIIVLGEILDYADMGTVSLYDVKVIRYLKNSQSGEILQVIGSGVHGKMMWIEDSTVFEIGERAVLYLENDDDTLRIGPYSFSTQLDIENPYWYFPYRWIMILGTIIGIIAFLVWRKRK